MLSSGVAFGIGTHTGTSEVMALSACCAACRPMKEMLKELRALYPGHVYVHGGYDGQRRLLSIERLAPNGDTWEPLPPITDRRAVTPGLLHIKIGFKRCEGGGGCGALCLWGLGWRAPSQLLELHCLLFEASLEHRGPLQRGRQLGTAAAHVGEAEPPCSGQLEGPALRLRRL